RLFVSLHYLATAVVLVGIWRQLFPEGSPYRYRSMWFLPILLWQCNIVSYYFLPANLLEASLSLFDLLAIWVLLVPEGKRVWSRQLLAGQLIGLALLSKGPVGAFPLAFWICHQLAFGQLSWWEAGKRTLMLTLSSLLGLVLLCGLFPEALVAFGHYFDEQLLASLEGTRRQYYYRDSRLYILGQLLWTLLPMLLLGGLAMAYGHARKGRMNKQTFSWALFFGLTALSASLPLVVSPRQALPYLLPSLPYFSLSIAVVSAPFALRCLLWGHRTLAVVRPWMEWGGLALLILLAGWIYGKSGQSNQRDASLIEDVQLIGPVLGESQLVSSDTFDMYISGYLMRWYQVSLDTSQQIRPYWLTSKGNTEIPTGYKKVDLPTQQFDLYEKDESIGGH
ncbi:MAG: hypothetical protein AAFV25_13895, partial [Bacteroidota bacterium]